MLVVLFLWNLIGWKDIQKLCHLCSETDSISDHDHWTVLSFPGFSCVQMAVVCFASTDFITHYICFVS